MEEIVYTVMSSCKVYVVFRDKENAEKYLLELREKVGWYAGYEGTLCKRNYFVYKTILI